MKKNFMRSCLSTAAAAIATVVMVAPAAALSAGAGYNSIPDPLPSSSPSVGFEATQTAEWGAQIQLAAANKNYQSATVVMNSWACESGSWTADCVTTPGATFSQQLTLNIYNVGTGGLPGSQITSVTQTFNIPYRPTSGGCSDPTEWQNAQGDCQHGLNVPVTFNLSNVSLPQQIIFGVAYNTQTAGYSPLHVDGPYDSLNVAAVDPATVTTGTSQAIYSANGSTPVFQDDSADYVGYTPTVSFNLAAAEPTNKDQCKNNGWQQLVNNDGKSFKNQGDCVSFVVANPHSGKN